MGALAIIGLIALVFIGYGMMLRNTKEDEE
jgi:Na+/H+ antiporter NhaC